MTFEILMSLLRERLLGAVLLWYEILKSHNTVLMKYNLPSLHIIKKLNACQGNRGKMRAPAEHLLGILLSRPADIIPPRLLLGDWQLNITWASAVNIIHSLSGGERWIHFYVTSNKRVNWLFFTFILEMVRFVFESHFSYFLYLWHL